MIKQLLGLSLVALGLTSSLPLQALAATDLQLEPAAVHALRWAFYAPNGHRWEYSGILVLRDGEIMNNAFPRTLKKIDAVGFSLGGMIVQQLSVEHPELLNRIVLLGTGPRGGEGMTFNELSLDELKDPAALTMKSFFTPSENSQAADGRTL